MRGPTGAISHSADVAVALAAFSLQGEAEEELLAGS